jgi:uncharacterized protein (DUF849 family)
VILQACLNGDRAPGTHPALPVSPEALARDAAACVAAGAQALHLHVRDGDGRESLDADAMDATLAAVRAAAPGVEVSVSTGLWITAGDAMARLAHVDAWRALPDSASVNVIETGWAELARALSARGVRVEIGLWSAEGAEAFAASDLEPACVRALVEPHDEEAGAAIVTATAIDRMLGQAGVRLPRLHHGTDRTTWSVLDAAVPAGRDVRIGLEDTLVLPDGAVTPDNATLVRAARERYGG